MREFIAKLVLLLIVVLPLRVASQEWLPDRSSREGPGIMLGDSLVFHPGLGVEGGYDTNPMRYSQDFNGAGRLRVTPYLDLVSRSERHRVQDEGVVAPTRPKIDLQLGLAGYYDVYFSDMENINKQDHFGIDSKINFILFPEGVFSLLAEATYARSMQPYESSEEHWAWHNITPGIGFRLRPGGGTLSLELGYRLSLMFFEDSLLASRNDKQVHDLRFITSWKVMPKTAVVSKVYFSPTLYTGSDAFNNNSMPVRSLFGVQGLLTPRFGMSLFAGYGASFYEQGDNFDSFIANGELMFFLTPTANIRLGGDRDFVDSFYANFYTKTGGYLAYEQMFGGLVLGSLKGEVYHKGYAEMQGDLGTVAGEVAVPSEGSRRTDVWIGATALLEFRATDWLSFHVSAKLQSCISEFSYDIQSTNQNTGETNQTTLPVDFYRVEVFGGVRGHY
jgi:hypothetical protein